MLVVLLVTCVMAWTISKLLLIGRRHKTLPPGPPTLPILGNMHQIPLKFPFLEFSKWANQYGGIISLKVLNTTILVVSDVTIVKELLEDRTNETSNRPFLHAVHAVTEENYFPFAHPGEYSHIWKAGRNALKPLVSPQAVQAHLPIAEAETTRLLHDVLSSPENFCSHVSRLSFSLTSSVVYGKSAPTIDTPEVTLFAQYFRHLSETMLPCAVPVDLIPVLKYLPEFCAPWKKLWRKTRSQQRALYFSLLKHAEHRLEDGQMDGCVIQGVLEHRLELELSREMIGYIGGVMIDAATDSTSALIQSLILCLLKNPSSLQRAQAEIDSIVGSNRLPELDDIKYLPYVQSVIREVHRLRPVGPLGVPHAASKDCEYRGYIIPKGAPILMNIWGVMHDPELFERPDDFWPERYLLTADGTKPGLEKGYTIRPSFVFGSGKRLCPGMHLATTNTNLITIRLIWAFDFSPADGSTLSDTKWNLVKEYNDGLAFTPKPFKCKIIPRGKERVQVIEESFKQLVPAVN